MKKKEIITRSKEETVEWGKQIAASLKAGDVIALSGNLGAGKTTLIKGLALGLGLHDQDEVKSPTFALMHVYETQPPLYHFDLYRLETNHEIANIGFEEYVHDPSIITCVEWAERAEDLMPKNIIRIHLEIQDEGCRRIQILS